MFKRGRRLRVNNEIRDLVRENTLSASDFIYPLFVVEGENIKNEISSLPGNYHVSIDRLDEVVKEILEAKVKGIILFGIPAHKDACGTEASTEDGIVQKAVRKIRELTDKLLVITDVCMCEYTDHGHCGIIKDNYVQNDETLKYLSKIAVSYADAGVDVVAPSDMMDGRVGAIREALDKNDYINTPIFSYAAKYASTYYAPFRDAADSTPSFGDRKSYQMDPANFNEAIREVALDVQEGTDAIIVKPALAYLDVLREVKQTFKMPTIAYQVSGEYSMIQAGIEKGYITEDLLYETLLSIKRAGADMIISYFVPQLLGIE